MLLKFQMQIMSIKILYFIEFNYLTMELQENEAG